MKFIEKSKKFVGGHPKLKKALLISVGVTVAGLAFKNLPDVDEEDFDEETFDSEEMFDNDVESDDE